MDHEFIAEIETWGSGGQMLDVVTLKNGKILVITVSSVLLYESRAAFEAGEGGEAVHPEGRRRRS